MTDSIETPEEEKVREAVAKTERSFGATFKRLKSENEELKTQAEQARADFEAAKAEMEQRIQELGGLADERERHLSEIAVEGEITRQLRESGSVPERFIDRAAIVYVDDPKALAAHVAEVLDRGRAEFEGALAEAGIDRTMPAAQQVNPTNPPNRDATTARSLKRADARNALMDMTRRGLIRR